MSCKMKKCSRCGKLKEYSEFHKNRTSKDGLQTTCKKCRQQHSQINQDKLVLYRKEYRQKNKKQINKRDKRYYETNKDRFILYHQVNRDKILSYNRNYTQKIKLKVIKYYSNNKIECNLCGFKDIKGLSIDHMNGGGCQHRKKFNISSGSHFYGWLIKNNFPDGFQVLCMNCQFIKKLENDNECNRNSNPNSKQLIQQIKNREQKQKLKQDIISVYSNGSNSCIKCGCSDIRCLTLDHINNNGSVHRKEINAKGGGSLYYKLRKNNYPNNPPLQVLCMNCNRVKCYDIL